MRTFQRSIFERFPWLNLVMTILITILELAVAIVDYFRGRYVWTVVFVILFLLYLIVMIPMSYRIMKRTIYNNKQFEELEKRIREMEMESK